MVVLPVLKVICNQQHIFYLQRISLATGILTTAISCMLYSGLQRYEVHLRLYSGTVNGAAIQTKP